MSERPGETPDTMDMLHALKAELDQKKGPEFYQVIEEMISIAHREGIASAETFKELGFRSPVADVLEAIPKGRAGLGDLVGAWEL